MDASYFVYKGDENWYDINSLLADFVMAIIASTAILELFRGVAHCNSMFAITHSGIKDAMNMSDREMDIARTFFYLWGLASLILGFAYLQPFLYGKNLTDMVK